MATAAGESAAPETRTRADSAIDAGAPGHEQQGKQTRLKRPRIDLDDAIARAQQAMKEAQKSVADARRQGRNERRKKQRLLKKASGLSADDLERIAVLKRCGLHSKDGDGD